MASPNRGGVWKESKRPNGDGEDKRARATTKSTGCQGSQVKQLDESQPRCELRLASCSPAWKGPSDAAVRANEGQDGTRPGAARKKRDAKERQR